MALICFTTSCSNETEKEFVDPSTCELVGKWCQIVSSISDECLANTFEFKSDGQFIATTGNPNSKWETVDCQIIEISNSLNNQTSTYEVISIMGEYMTLDLGANGLDPFEFKRS